MALNFTIPRTTSHARSTSLPSITNHHLDSTIEALFCKLRQAAPTTSASAICLTLNNIHCLYNDVNSSILCPMNQQLLSLEQNRDGVEIVLEGSLGLIDSCASTKDAVSLMKESIVELRSSLRRKNGGDEKDVISAYLMSRKNVRKMANKCIRNVLKINSRKNEGGSSSKSITILRVVEEVEAVSVSTLKSILTYMSKWKESGKGWSLVAKLINSKRVSCNEEDGDSEIQRIDGAVLGLEPKKGSVNAKMVAQEIVEEVEKLESYIEEIEGCLELISRCLLKTRISLLNVVSSC